MRCLTPHVTLLPPCKSSWASGWSFFTCLFIMFHLYHSNTLNIPQANLSWWIAAINFAALSSIPQAPLRNMAGASDASSRLRVDGYGESSRFVWNESWGILNLEVPTCCENSELQYGPKGSKLLSNVFKPILGNFNRTPLEMPFFAPCSLV